MRIGQSHYTTVLKLSSHSVVCVLHLPIRTKSKEATASRSMQKPCVQTLEEKLQTLVLVQWM